MSIEDVQSDKAIIEENAAYVLGMYDLYPDEKDIVEALKQKGIPNRLVQPILDRVKQPAYEKRKRQAKRMIWIGAILIVSLLLVALLLRSLPHTENFTEVRNSEDSLGLRMFNFYKRIFFYVLAIGVFQVLIGLFQHVKFSRLLKKAESFSG